MDMSIYQKDACRTKAAGKDKDLQMAILALGVAGEAGEVADYIKKFVGHGHALDRDKLANELGDVLWYVAVLADEIGYDLGTVAFKNIEKLKARYPSGFSSERSINRQG